MANNYIAVTIGPVLDTINLASSPSALWAASYMMSMLSKNICLSLIKRKVPQEDIVSPYFDEKNVLFNRKDGVGLFHDRVIFKADNFNIKDFPAVRDEAIKNTVAYFGFTKDKDIKYFKEYFLVSAVLLENSTNPIMDSGKKLDCLELAKSFVSSQDSNPILSFYNSEDITTSPSRNDAIRIQVTDKKKGMGIENWQLLDDCRRIRSIPDIARGRGDEKKWKKYNYYAVVRSDGDRITSIIQNLKPGEIRGFSEKCMNYCAEIAKTLHEKYGGVTIYSGGDDLLALMPVEYESMEGIKNIFEFTKEANNCFIQTFKNPNQEENDETAKKSENHSQNISLSFGIFVAYSAFPLYEALEQSADLLFGVAKNIKNCVAICFQKHSGQSEGLIIPNKDMQEYITFHNNCIKNTSEDADEKVIYSAMHKFALFDDMFNNSAGAELENVFKNIFDGDKQKFNSFLQKDLYEFFKKLKENLNISMIKGRDKDEKDLCSHALKMEYILRIIKFFKEKAGEGE